MSAEPGEEENQYFRSEKREPGHTYWEREGRREGKTFNLLNYKGKEGY